MTGLPEPVRTPVVEQADGGGVLGQEPPPGNWDWLRFLIGVLAFDLLVSVSGVSA
jgi:hypothetical protein